MKINKSNVESAELPVGKDQVFYRDDQLKGFALRVTATGTKSFVVEKNIGNKPGYFMKYEMSEVLTV